MGALNDFDFKPGDIVSFCDEEAVVVDNSGSYGWVDVGGSVHVRWHWVFQGTPVILVKKANLDRHEPKS